MNRLFITAGLSGTNARIGLVLGVGKSEINYSRLWMFERWCSLV